MLRTVATTEKMRTPATASAVLHASVLAVAFFGLPDLFNRPQVEPEPVMIEFEAIDKKAAAPVVGNPPPQPKDAPIAEETAKAPPPKTAEPTPAPETPKPPEPQVAAAPPPPKPEPKPEPPKPPDDAVALKPKEPEPPKVEKPPEPPKPAPVAKKPDPPKPAPPKPAPTVKEKSDALLDDILKNKEKTPNTVRTPEQAPKPPQQVTRQAPAAPQLSAVVTASEVEGVRQKIRPCWNFPHGIKDQHALIVTLIVQMNQNGTPVKVELKDTGRYNNDPAFRAAADSAQRAIMNPRCQPWPLAAEKYNNWRTITFNFDPRDY